MLAGQRHDAPRARGGLAQPVAQRTQIGCHPAHLGFAGAHIGQQLHRFAGAVEEGGADAVLDAADAPGKGGLREVAGHRRAGKGAGVEHRKDIFEPIETHGSGIGCGATKCKLCNMFCGIRICAGVFAALSGV